MASHLGKILLIISIVLSITNAIPSKTTNSRQCCEEYCYETDSIRSQYAELGTKTAYQKVKGTLNNNQQTVQNCTPEKIWMLIRHGTRMPSTSGITKLATLVTLRDEILKNYETIENHPTTGGLCQQDLELLRQWQWSTNLTIEYENFLTTQGWNDLKGIAEQYKLLYPTIFGTTYAADRFLFHYTPSQRTEASYKAFVDGLFGDQAYEHIQLPAQPDLNMLLKPYDICDLWEENSDEKNNPDSERQKFEELDSFKQMISDISTRLGFKESIDFEDIKLIYDMCRYDKAWDILASSPWCTTLTKSQIQMLEYHQDLKYYYQVGPGFDLNNHLACTAVQDMLNHMEHDTTDTDDDVVDEDNEDNEINVKPNVIAYFAHSSSVQLVLTALGVAKDSTHLLATNYDQVTDRKFRSSELTPFAANIVAVKYKCQDNNNNGETNPITTKVKFFLNEKPLQLTGCDENGLCNWSDLHREYGSFQTANCEEIYCSKGIHLVVSLSSFTLLITFIITIFGQYLY